jgi:hypothetical protein
MRKRSSSRDVNEMAAKVVDGLLRLGDSSSPKKKRKNPAAVALGKRGGKKGGPARAAALSGDRRSEIARLAAVSRWKRIAET